MFQKYIIELNGPFWLFDITRGYMFHHFNHQMFHFSQRLRNGEKLISKPGHRTMAISPRYGDYQNCQRVGATKATNCADGSIEKLPMFWREPMFRV